MIDLYRKCALLMAFLAAIALPATAQVTYYVRGDGSGNDANAGTSWPTAFATIQQACNQIGGKAPTNNVTINIQASTGSHAYYVAQQLNLTAQNTNYIINVSGGWTDVDGTPTQNGTSLVTDNVGPIDQPGLWFAGGGSTGGQSSPRTVTVTCMTFTGVTYGVNMSPLLIPATPYPCNPYLILDRCSIAAQSHGVYINYPSYGNGGLNQQSFFSATNSTITGGLGGSGDGVRIISAYSLVDISPNTTVTGAGSQNVYLQDNYNDSQNPTFDRFTCNFRGSVGMPGTGYDLVKNGMETMVLTNSSALTRKVAINGALVWAKAQNAGPCLTTGTVEMNASVALRLDPDLTVTNTSIGPIAARNAQPEIYVNGVSTSNTWTTAALSRENRAVLTVRGNTANTYTLTTNDLLKITAPPAVANGMVSPWIMGTDSGFLTYDGSGPGLKPAVYTRTNTIDSAVSTDILLCNVLQTQTVDRTVYALRCDKYQCIITNLPGGATNTLTLASGGLSASWYYTGTSAKDYLIASNLKFGTAGEKEALLFIGAANDLAKILVLQGSLITTNGLTKGGYNTLRLDGNNTGTLSGPITIDSGTLQLNNPSAIPPNLPVSIFAYIRPSLADGSFRTISGGLDLNGYNLAITNLTLGDAGVVRNSAATPATLTLNGNVSFVGLTSQVTPSAGTAIASTLANPLTLDMGSVRRTFNVARGSAGGTDLPVSALVIGSGGLTKTGDGTLSLSCVSNTFTGGITVQGGTFVGVITNIGPSTPFGDPGNAIALQKTATLVYSPLNSAGCTSTVGTVTFSGANSIAEGNAATKWTNTVASLDRASGTRGTLFLMGNSQYVYFGYDATMKLLATTAPAVNNGMLAPYFVHALYPGAAAWHCTYDPVLGIKPCAYNKSGAFTATSLVATDLVDVTTLTAAAGTNFTADIACWAMRTVRGISMTNGPWTLTLGSGGLLANSTVSIAPYVKFGSSGTNEGLIYVSLGSTAWLTNSLVTTGGLTKFGPGMLFLGTASPNFSGDTYVQAGTLALGSANALGTGASTVYVESGAVLDVFTNAMTNITVKGTGLVATYGSVPFTGKLSPAGEGAIGTLSVGTMDFRGTYTWEYNATGGDLVQAAGLTFGGSATLNVSWIGSGNAATGTNALFNYACTDPSLGAWNVKTPAGITGTVSLDTPTKRVLLTLSKTKSGTCVMFR